MTSSGEEPTRPETNSSRLGLWPTSMTRAGTSSARPWMRLSRVMGLRVVGFLAPDDGFRIDNSGCQMFGGLGGAGRRASRRCSPPAARSLTSTSPMRSASLWPRVVRGRDEVLGVQFGPFRLGVAHDRQSASWCVFTLLVALVSWGRRPAGRAERPAGLHDSSPRVGPSSQRQDRLCAWRSAFCASSAHRSGWLAQAAE